MSLWLLRVRKTHPLAELEVELIGSVIDAIMILVLVTGTSARVVMVAVEMDDDMM